MSKYVCIHSHFYQPPRENPWLEEIEVQDSAYPYRDWNERVTAECYSPNTAARILDAEGIVINIINNYSKISFNFGPTLLSWMEVHAPDIYSAILQADKESRQKFSGHGSAIAQVYNHMIMPLANERDKRTQVIWGIEDFRTRFGRMPEGMWLAETGVDVNTLEILANQEIKFTILAPRQAGKIKKFKDKEWFDVSNSRVDPRRSYLCRLPSGREINIFFYDGAISQDLAFGDLLSNGENLANRLVNTLDDEQNFPQIANIATDGETYGHHQKHGDMALAYCLNFIETNELAELTVYGEYLEKHPAEYEVEIINNTSWSCIHGIERWRSDCGCNSGRPGWNQEWRKPLREALDWLGEELIPYYEKEVKEFSDNVWKLRDEYIRVILDRSPESLDEFLSSNGIKNISKEEKVKLLKMLEIQRHAMLMYTSCGWFFDEISGIETVQVILYAARAIQLLNEVKAVNLEDEFTTRLEKAPSNISQVPNGKVVYRKYVKPAIIDLQRVAAHFAVSSLFEDYPGKTQIYSYEIENLNYDYKEAGKQKLIIGRSVMRSRITYEEKVISFAFIHLGDHNLNGGVRESFSDDQYIIMNEEVKKAFSKLNIAEIILLIDKHFGTHNYTLWHLFKDESRNVFNKIMSNTLKQIEFSFRQVYENHYPVMQAMKDSETPLPKAIFTAVEFVVNTDFKRLLKSEGKIDLERLRNISDEVKKWSVELDKLALGYAGSQRINSLVEDLRKHPEDISILEDINSSIKTLKDLSLDLDIWKAQNILFNIVNKDLKKVKKLIEEENQEFRKWVEQFNDLGKNLQVRINIDAHPEFNIQAAV